jgi:hypothetical protein
MTVFEQMGGSQPQGLFPEKKLRPQVGVLHQNKKTDLEAGFAICSPKVSLTTSARRPNQTFGSSHPNEYYFLLLSIGENEMTNFLLQKVSHRRWVIQEPPFFGIQKRTQNTPTIYLQHLLKT